MEEESTAGVVPMQGNDVKGNERGRERKRQREREKWYGEKMGPK